MHLHFITISFVNYFQLTVSSTSRVLRVICPSLQTFTTSDYKLYGFREICRILVSLFSPRFLARSRELIFVASVSAYDNSFRLRSGYTEARNGAERRGWHVPAVSIRSSGRKEKLFQRSWNVLSCNAVLFPTAQLFGMPPVGEGSSPAEDKRTYKHVLRSFPLHNLPLLAARERLPEEIVKYHKRQAILCQAYLLTPRRYCVYLSWKCIPFSRSCVFFHMSVSDSWPVLVIRSRLQVSLNTTPAIFLA